jgi:EAL domain-containing protein (putative c-di-GMP-specific phosphodiesterase class I)
MKHGQERRSSIRRPIHHEAILHLASYHVPCVIADYCPDGMFLKFDKQYVEFLNTLRKEDLLDISFIDALGQEFHIGAHLAHMMKGACGIRFTSRFPEAIKALVSMNRGRNTVPNDEMKVIVEECITQIQDTTLPLMTDLWPALIEEVKQASLDAQSDQKANQIMATAEKIEKDQQVLQSSFSLGVQDPLSVYSSQVDMSSKMNDTLSLVDKGDFEDWLISRVLITKCETHYRAELLPLKVRLDAIGVGDKKHHQSVFGPALLVSAYQSAISPLRLGSSLEKLVFKVFENQVMMSLDSLYLGLNQILVNHNILPTLDLAGAIRSRDGGQKKTPVAEEKNKETQPENSPQGSRNTNPARPSSERSFSARDRATSGLDSIAQPARNETAHANNVHQPDSPSFIDSLGGGTGQADTHSSSITAPPFQTEGVEAGPVPGTSSSAGQQSSFHQNQADVQQAVHNVVGLMRSLREKAASQSNRSLLASAPNASSESQSTSNERYSEVELAEGLSELQGASDADVLEDRPSLLSRVQENLKQQGSDKQFNEQQQVAIDVVDRFFHSMRNNPRISSEAKQHLLKLEVPVLKVLLKDERFFEDHNSSVRAVMNRIAQLGAKGATLNPASRKRVAELVEQIVQEFEQDTSVFDLVLAELDKLIEKQNKLYVKNVERVAAAADGVHKVDEAKVAVAKALNERLSGKKVPAAVSVLIDNGWKELLNLTHIKHGEDSEQWQSYLSVLDQLIAFGDNPEIPVDAKHIIPVIQEGLKTVSGTNEASGEVRESLKQLIQNAPRGKHSMVQATLQALPETEDELVKKNLSKSQALKPWIIKAKSIEAGTWLRLEKADGESQYMRLVWIAKGYSKFVCVNHQGMKVVELGLLKFARYLRDKKISLDIEYEQPMVNQSLDNMVAEVYDKIAYESNYDEGSGLVRKSEFCRQVRSIMKTGKRTAECFLIYIRFYDTQTDKVSGIDPAFAKNVAERLNGLRKKEGVLGRVNESDFVLFTADSEEEFLGLRCQDLLETLCESSETKLSVLIGESKAHMGFFNPESMIRHALELVDENFDRISGTNETHEEESSGQQVHSDENEVEDESKIPTLYLDESQNILPEEEDFSALVLNSKIQKVECLNMPQDDSESGDSIILQNHANLVCFVEGDEQPFEVSDGADARDLDVWWIDQITRLYDQGHPIFEDASYIRVQISGYSLNNSEFIEQLLDLHKRDEIPGSKICFDVYDCSAIEDIHTALGDMRRLKAQGFKFCLDHFGSERSPFAFLKALPFDIIKIDESFMNELNDTEGDEIAADSIIEIAHYLGKKVLASEVDSAICLQKMKRLNVDFVQGTTVSSYVDV